MGLEEESFELRGSSREETSGNIAKAFGLISIPNGVCNTFVALVLYVPVTKRFGDVKTTLTAGIIVSVNFAAYGVLPSKLWHLCVLQAITGVCFGFIIPALSPLMGRYAGAHYPSQMAECQGITILGMNLSMAFGQNALAFVHSRFGMEYAWVVCAASCAMFVALFVASCMLVDHRSPKPGLLTAEQKKVALKIGGEDVDKFI